MNWVEGRSSVLLFGFSALLIQTSCSPYNGYPKDYENTSAVISAAAPWLLADVQTKGDSTNDNDRGGLSQEAFRNEAVNWRLEVIDINYDNMVSSLDSTSDSISLGSDLTVLILNGFGATTGAAATKAALAAASAGVVGADASINKDVFYQKTVSALIAQMDAARQTAKVSIVSGLTKPVSQYSIDQALNDVQTYYLAGTIQGAVDQVTTTAGAELNTANDELARIRNSQYVAPGATAKQIINWLYPGGDETKAADPSKLAQLQNWMTNDTVDPVLNSIPPQNLLTGSNLPNAEDDRQRAIKALNIP